MRRHDAPREEPVSLTIKMHQRALYDFGYCRIGEQTRPVATVERLINFSEPLRDGFTVERRHHPHRQSVCNQEDNVLDNFGRIEMRKVSTAAPSGVHR